MGGGGWKTERLKGIEFQEFSDISFSALEFGHTLQSATPTTPWLAGRQQQNAFYDLRTQSHCRRRAANVATEVVISGPPSPPPTAPLRPRQPPLRE